MTFSSISAKSAKPDLGSAFAAGGHNSIRSVRQKSLKDSLNSRKTKDGNSNDSDFTKDDGRENKTKAASKGSSSIEQILKGIKTQSKKKIDAERKKDSDPNSPINSEKQDSRFDARVIEKSDPKSVAVKYGLYPPPSGTSSDKNETKANLAMSQNESTNTGSQASTGASSAAGQGSASSNVNNGAWAGVGGVQNPGASKPIPGGGVVVEPKPTTGGPLIKSASVQTTSHEDLNSIAKMAAETGAASVNLLGDGRLSINPNADASEEARSAFKEHLVSLSHSGGISEATLEGIQEAHAPEIQKQLNEFGLEDQHLACNNGTCSVTIHPAGHEDSNMPNHQDEALA